MARWAQQQPPSEEPVGPFRRDRTAGLLGQAGSLVRPVLCLKSLLCVVSILRCCPPQNLDSSSRLPGMSILPCLQMTTSRRHRQGWTGGSAGRQAAHRRFGRYNLRDMKHAMQRHFCCVCQRVFCHHHTSYSPHGPFGSCGMESQCICDGCYATLPKATQVSALLTTLAVHHGWLCSLYRRHAVAKNM